MSERPPSDHPAEPALRALFDGSAEEPGGALLTRMRARAADVPAHVRRRPRFIPRWAWAPAFAGLGVAGLTALAAVYSIDWGGAESEAPVARAADAVIAPAQAEPKPVSEEADDVPALADDFGADDAEAAARLGDLELDPLDGLAADDDLDAWLFATEELARQGG